LVLSRTSTCIDDVVDCAEAARGAVVAMTAPSAKVRRARPRRITGA